MTRANDCAPTPHLHVGICQRTGYANGLADGRAELGESALADWQRPDVEPDQDLINAATVIRRIATRPNRHPDTAAILLPIADDLRRRALDTRTPDLQEPPC